MLEGLFRVLQRIQEIEGRFQFPLRRSGGEDRASSQRAPRSHQFPALLQQALQKVEATPAQKVRPYWAETLHAAHLTGLDPDLLSSVMEAESGFNPRAISSKGAQGLMQLMPETAKGLGVQDPFAEGENIAGGARYLKSLLDRFSDLRLALAAYNAGPAAVEKFQGIPPYPETQQYVERVLSIYRAKKR